MAKIEKYLLHLAGEYRVCSELNKRGVFATITYGNRKAVDVYVIGDRAERALKIEVKTSQHPRFVTSITRTDLADDPTAPDFWVLFHLKPQPDGRFTERFFILSHEEICKAQAARSRAYCERYEARHGKPFDSSRGVAGVTIDDVVRHEDEWPKIIDAFG